MRLLIAYYSMQGPGRIVTPGYMLSYQLLSLRDTLWESIRYITFTHFYRPECFGHWLPV